MSSGEDTKDDSITEKSDTGTETSHLHGEGDVLTKEVVEQERLEAERRKKAEADRAQQRAREFRARKDFKEINTQKVKKLEFLLKQTSTYSSFLENQLLASLKPTDEPPSKRRKLDSKRAQEDAADRQRVAAGSTTTFKQPPLLTGGTLREYQLDGVQWMVSLYENGINGILGDEMGLGKTLQTIGFLAHLKSNQVHGPFLVIGPLNTLNNWTREFTKFAPAIKTVLYHGTKQVREAMRKKQFKSLNRRNNEDENMPVIITSYEIILKDAAFLRKFNWKIIVVDEGHRLKNKDCVLLKELKNYRSSNRLLLSGTPLQNSLKELWSLLNFLLPDIFSSVEDFESWFDFLEIENHESTASDHRLQENFVSKLHAILKPFLLRRVKTDVECSIPPKKEVIVYTHLTPLQAEYYAALLRERSDVDDNGKGAMKRLMAERGLERSATASTSMSLQSIVVQLRKCCNHPFLFGEERAEDGEFATDERIVESCGKMMLLDRLLRRLKEDGHKVLLYSQMTQLLDIIEDYCALRHLKYCRLDGTTTQSDRVDQMDQFNADPEVFLFLLSTKAGGVGVNLIAADTVIFYDSDWNPHQDLQAQDRAHRIGQTRPVMIYRLVTRPSIEERIIERANSKRKLDRVVIQKGAYKGRNSLGHETTITASELKAILEHEVLSDMETPVRQMISDEEIEEVLDRTRMSEVKEGKSYKVVPQSEDQILSKAGDQPQDTEEEAEGCGLTLQDDEPVDDLKTEQTTSPLGEEM